MNYIVKREFHHRAIKDSIEENFFVVRIYDKRDNTILAEGEPSLDHYDTKIIYEGLEYWNIPNKGDYITLITLKSILNKFEKNEKI